MRPQIQFSSYFHFKEIIKKHLKNLEMIAIYPQAILAFRPLTPQNEKLAQVCFKNDTQFELFRSEKDYTNVLASITDTEYTSIKINWFLIS